jgi:hypothetical protein
VAGLDSGHLHHADERDAIPDPHEVGRVEHARRRLEARIEHHGLVGETGHRRHGERRGRGVRQALVEVAAPARALDLAARERDEPLDRGRDPLEGIRACPLALNRCVDRPVLAVQDVGFIDIVKVEQSKADVLVQPGRVRSARIGFADACVAQPDRFLGQGQIVEARCDRAVDLGLLPEHRHRVGPAARGDQDTPAQHGRDQEDHCARQEHARAEATVEGAAVLRRHQASPLLR